VARTSHVRLSIAFAATLFAGMVFAQEFTADVNATRKYITSGDAQANIDKVRQQTYGNVDTSVAVTLGGHQSPEQLKAANLARISECRNAAENSFAGMSVQQKNECNAVITAAGVLFTKNPYLDSKNPNSAGITRQELVPSQSKINAAGRSVGSGGDGSSEGVGYSAPVTNKRTCMDATGKVTESGREEVCSEERLNTPAECQVTYDVKVADDGKITTVANDTACLPYSSTGSCEPSGAQCKVWKEYLISAFDGDPNPKKESVCIDETRGFDCFDTSGPWHGTGCTVASDPTCRRTGGTTVTHTVNGAAVHRDVDYYCDMPPIVNAVPGSCVTQTCIGETCMDNTQAPSPDLANMAVGMELLREAGTYALGGGASNPENLRLFRGISDNCKRPTGGWFGANCCNAKGGDVITNRDVLPSIGMQVAGKALMSVSAYGISQAAHGIHDWMFPDSKASWMQAKGSEFLTETAGKSPEFGMSFGAYGVSLQVGVPGAGFSWSSLVPDGVTAGANSALASSGMADAWAGSGLKGAWQSVSEIYNSATWSSGTFNMGGLDFALEFNPYMMAAIVAYQIIQEMNACTVDEEMLSARRGQRLCQKTGQRCSKKLPWPLKTCIQITETWCCWNSRLAQTVAIQGGRQLGRSNNCGGFTPDELASLDFSRIDLASVTAELVAHIASPDQRWNNSITSAVQNRVGDMPKPANKGIMVLRSGTYSCGNGPTTATLDVDVNGGFYLKGHFTSHGKQDYQTAGYTGSGMENTWTIGNTGRYGSAALAVTADTAELTCVAPDTGTDRVAIPMDPRDDPINPDNTADMKEYTADIIRRRAGGL
jgi:hypothetical protein